MKRCPQCAEQVQGAALACRFCGHQFPAKEAANRGLIESLLGGLKIAAVVGVPLALISFCASQAPSSEPAKAVESVDMCPHPDHYKMDVDYEKSLGLLKEDSASGAAQADDDLWAQRSADDKRDIARAVYCVRYKAGGARSGLMVYGYRSGKELAYAWEDGVDLK